MACKVSVVIPAYNVEKYVCFAVNSVLRQTLEDIEIIVVNDCSTDRTAEVLSEHFSDEKRVKLLTQPQNMGVGEARNRGIKEATGEYIAFLDSDDAMLPDALKSLYDAVGDADVVSSPGCLLTKTENPPEDLLQLGDDELSPMILNLGFEVTEPTLIPEDRTERMQGWVSRNFNYVIWNKLFRREFLINNNITFSHLSMAEDHIFTFKCIYFAEKYCMIPGLYYLYRTAGPESLSKQGKSMEQIKKLVNAQIGAAACLTEFMDDKAFFSENKELRTKVIWNALDSIDTFYLVPTVQELGTADLKNDGMLYDIYAESFGINKAYVEYLFYRMHESAGAGIDINSIFKDSDSWGNKE